MVKNLSAELSLNRLMGLLDSPCESANLDFKETLDLSQGRDRVEFAKDVLAMANSGGGHIVVGVEDDSRRRIGIDKDSSAALQESKIINDKFKKYCGGYIKVFVAQHEIHDLAGDSARFALIVVPGVPAKVPAQDDGAYPDPGNPKKQKWAFRRGDVYIRKGDESVKVETPEDLHPMRAGFELGFETARHLDFLSDFSRTVFATLNPDEMLANVAAELEKGLPYSHIGIGLLDYSTKEIIVSMEAGPRKGALGRHLGLEGNVLGKVARTGEMAVVTYPTSSNPKIEPVLEGSTSAIALPIVYKDQLHGVFYVETDDAADFRREEIRLLTTLTELISGMIHNGLIFQKAEERSNTDPLTGVRNRRFFDDALRAECKVSASTSKTFTVVGLDLDKFKVVNDTYGHLEGDEVLKRVADLLYQACPKAQTISRYGGDEFAILIPGVDTIRAYELVDGIRAKLSADELLMRRGITGSFGLASYPRHGTTPEQILQAADEQTWLSKQAGGNRVSCGGWPGRQVRV